MATRSSILAWEISWTEERGGLQSMGSQESLLTFENIYFFSKKSVCLKARFYV